ncbi:MAG TPA: methylated-DNA--[protein]-cysteine S-methyltransferase [Acidimicrobiales bacterium]|nr:methylated-DNA--[protein]-cysteine S-methyltransferase [Acidimicrobiales bacterium]
MTMTIEQPDKDLAELFGPSPGEDELAPLYAQLVDRADSEGLLDLAYRTLDTPVGALLLAATPAGLVRVAYEREGLDTVLNTLADKVSPRILETPRRLDEVARQLDEYFAGQRTAFELSIDLSLSAGFRRSVLTYLPAIAYGETASYQSVAAAVDNPKAVRAVGTACATNPLPVVIPCHRVIRSDGQLGAYLGGAEVKHQLLDLEAHR